MRYLIAFLLGTCISAALAKHGMAASAPFPSWGTNRGTVLHVPGKVAIKNFLRIVKQDPYASPLSLAVSHSVQRVQVDFPLVSSSFFPRMGFPIECQSSFSKNGVKEAAVCFVGMYPKHAFW